MRFSGKDAVAEGAGKRKTVMFENNRERGHRIWSF